MTYPAQISLVNGCFALDGGSIQLMAMDPHGKDVTIFLDWSIEAHRNGSVQLFFNGTPVPKRSTDERAILDLLEEAQISSSPDEQDSARLPRRRHVLGNDIQKITDAIDHGPASALKAMRDQLLQNVRSGNYTQP